MTEGGRPRRLVGAAWLCAVAAAGALSACRSDAPAASRGLRVALPDGWRAALRGEVLELTVQGRAVATLEPRDAARPEAAALVAALADEGVAGAAPEEGADFAGARYALEGGKEGFLAVKQVGPRTVWCASTARASPEELTAAYEVCRTLAQEGPGVAPVP